MALENHWTDDPTVNRSKEVPARHVDRLVAQFPEPRGPRRPNPEAWRGMLHGIALEIWSEAYAAGAAYGLGIGAIPRTIFITPEQQAAMEERMREKNAEVIADIEKKIGERE
jgi:hypothetical protein